MEEKGLFGALLDLSFTEFVTTKLIRIIYVLQIIVAVLVSLSFLFGCLMKGFLATIGGLIVAPIVFLMMVIVARVSLELVIVIFRIAEHVRDIAAAQKGEQPQP
jgi:uncharacterized membrane protein